MHIKTRFVQISIFILKSLMSFIYFIFKLFPSKQNKILFCSRQSDDVPLDFAILDEAVREYICGIQTVIICSRIENNLKGYIHFSICMFQSMYHLATSRVCIIDSYWPAVSMLKHKKNLKIIQIWHSLGKTKKSGYQAIGKKSGRKTEFAYMLKMHQKYDYLIGGAPIWNRYYCEAFNIEEEKILNYGLPRIDYLIDTEESNRELFFRQFPELKNKKIVLYAPTFRKRMKSRWNEIINVQKKDDIIIIIKNHPGQSVHNNKIYSKNIYSIEDWKTIDLIAVCDYIITDYSSIALEAAVLKKKTFYWTYDYDEYMKNSGINIDLKREVPDNLSDDINKIIDNIENDNYNIKQQEKYIYKYLPHQLGGSTEKIVNLIADLLKEQKVVEHEVRDNGRWQRKPLERSFEHFKTYGGNTGRTTYNQNDKVVAYDGTERLGNHSNVS